MPTTTLDSLVLEFTGLLQQEVREIKIVVSTMQAYCYIEGDCAGDGNDRNSSILVMYSKVQYDVTTLDLPYHAWPILAEDHIFPKVFHRFDT